MTEKLSERLAFQEMQEFAPTQKEVQEARFLEARVAELESCLDIIINLRDSEESRIARTYRR